MIITKTPFRISFVGGGSDLKRFYQNSPGAVLSTSIDKYMYITSHRFFDENKIRIKYSKTETVDSVNQIQHPIAREVLKKFNMNGAIEISSGADIPSGTGMGSSSSFTVGMLHNLHTFSGRNVTKEQLASEACEIEIDTLKEPIGKQDQYAASFGGLNIIKFYPNGKVEVEPINLAEETNTRLQNNLILFYLGNQREASSILSEQNENMKEDEKVEILKKMVELVWDAKDALCNNNLTEFGKILHRNWQLKQKLASKITTPFINEMYEKGIQNGAVGGKLLGAGGGGFLLFYCEKENREKLRLALHQLKEMKFKFDYEGSRIIYMGDEHEQN
ncbi:GHMP kinase [Candidatus Woesearchaeota archaeon CG_4_10_14_0_2_um_filter_33_13]|nr:MAG: GHMP kinase [Candidatus Woesearchaeota archaeon CG_4_10_14_0_2_um_filter_33_13]